MRLNRYLSASGVASRRRAEDIIRVGRVTVNGETVTDPARAVSERGDTVAIDGQSCSVSEAKRYFVLNKPTGTIVSRGDTHKRKTVYDILGSESDGIFAVGRLDYVTSGVLILTDDGDLAHRLMHPSWEVDKVYRAVVKGRVTDRDVEKVAAGLVLDDGPVSPAEMKILSASDKSTEVTLILHEGKKRQVRRMMDAIGHPVKRLDRTKFGDIGLKGLGKGKWRELTEDEVRALKKAVGLG